MYDTSYLVFPEDIDKFQDFIQPINEEDGTDRKGYIFIWLKFISFSFVCILPDSDIIKDVFISC
jgi:hypothetical protein